MSALVERLVLDFNFKVRPFEASDVASESVSEESSQIGVDQAGRLVGAASLYVVFVTGMLWSAPAWVVVVAPFVQAAVGRLMLWSLWK